MSSPTRDRVRDLSETMFRQRYRLELMVAVATSDDGLVCLIDLAASLGVTPSNLQRPLADLTSASLLTRRDAGDSRRRYYARNQSLAWEFALELLKSADARIDDLLHFDH